MILQPVSMRRLDRYEPTDQEPARTIAEAEFVATLADTARTLHLETPNGPQLTTAYGLWFGWWWVIKDGG